jgi:hypothetical protein
VIKPFEKNGIRFRYPDFWTSEIEDSDAGWTASLASPATAFIVLSLHLEEDDPSRLADTALAAMRESYLDLEADPVMETIAGQPAIGFDVNFFTLDLTNTCWIRSLQVPEGCLLILSQCTDGEIETNGAVLKAIQTSLEIEEI